MDIRKNSAEAAWIHTFELNSVPFGSESLIFTVKRGGRLPVQLGEPRMARLPRLYFPGCAQHVIQRGNNRQACFYQEARINGVSVIDS